MKKTTEKTYYLTDIITRGVLVGGQLYRIILYFFFKYFLQYVCKIFHFLRFLFIQIFTFFIFTLFYFLNTHVFSSLVSSMTSIFSANSAGCLLNKLATNAKFNFSFGFTISFAWTNARHSRISAFFNIFSARSVSSLAV